MERQERREAGYQDSSQKKKNQVVMIKRRNCKENRPMLLYGWGSEVNFITDITEGGPFPHYLGRNVRGRLESCGTNK